MGWADIVVLFVGIYAGVGLLVALAFVTVGISRVDPAAKGGPIGFRLLVLPGAAAMWPMVLHKWFHAGKGADDAA